MHKLALLGGGKTITYASPHVDLCKITPEDRQAILDFIDSPGATISYYGREGILADFEEELANFHNRKYCILTNSGTNAIHSAYFGIGLEPGDEVIAPTFTFLATVTPMLQLGAVPVLTDCDPGTGNIDPNCIKTLITPKTKAIIVTHQWGQPVDMDPIIELAKEYRLYVIEDLSLALGSTYKGRKVGSIGDVGVFSLGSTKMISGGQGGALITDDQEIMERSNLVGHFVRRSSQQVTSSYYKQFCDTGYGHNYRMHVLAVAIARARFKRLNTLIEERKKRLNLLSNVIAKTGILVPPVEKPETTRGSWVGYTVQFKPEKSQGVTLETLVKALQAEGLEVAQGSYHPLLHRTKFFQTMQDGFYKGKCFSQNKRIYKEGDFPIAEKHVDNQISFPIFLHEPLELVLEYGKSIKKVTSSLNDLLSYQENNLLKRVV